MIVTSFVTPTAPVLALRGLAVGYHGRPLLRDVNLEVTGGQIVSVLGANGSGKSTLLKTIIGTLPVIGGEIRLDGVPIEGRRIRYRVGAGIGLSPEGRRIFPSMTVLANLLVGGAALPRHREREGLERVLELFPELRTRLGQRAGTLSGGEAQMLAIGRAMMCAPRLLLVEEPSQGLAPTVIDRVYAGLRAVSTTGVAVLVAEQFQQLRREASDVVTVIRNGTLSQATDRFADPVAPGIGSRP